MLLHHSKRYDIVWMLLGLMAASLVLSACQSTPVQEAHADIAAVTETAVPQPSPTPLPVVVTTMATAVPTFDMPSFAPADPITPTATQTPPPPTEASMGTAESTATPTTEPTVTNTPMPTFTPPSLPLTSPDEHYWFRRPVPDGGVVWTDKVYPYGSTRGGELRPHHGVEFYVTYNTEIYAAASGTVVVAGEDNETAYGPETNFYGKLVVIEHDSRWQGQPVYTLYGHLNEVLVQVGQKVDMQELIGLSGATGVAEGPHLHFEVRVGQNSYANTRNPMLWLYPFPDYSTVAGRVTWPDGSLVEGAPVTLRRIDAPSPYQATTTYTGTSVNPDTALQENFVIDDVAAGYYEVEVDTGSEKYKEEFWVFPYRTAFVEIVLDGTP